MIGRRVGTAAVVVAAVTVGGVAGAVIGIPGLSGASSSSTTAQTGGSGPGPSSSDAPDAPHGFRGFPGAALGDKGVLDAAATALKMSTQDLLQKVSDGKTTIADVAKEQNVEVQTVIDAMNAVAKSDITDLVNNPFPVTPRFKGGRGPEGGAFGFGIRGSFDALAKALGISTDDLRSDLRNGQSIADIAKSKGADVNTIIGTLEGDAKSRIEAELKAGHLTQDEATKIETKLHDMIANVVNNSLPGGLGHFGGFGHRGGGDFGPAGPGLGGSGPMPVHAPAA